MSDEKAVQNGGAETEKRASVGKIARLPKAIREQLNRRLEDGEPASALTEWLNELPEVKKALHKYFGGAAISEKNLSNWRLTGYARWVERQELLGEVREMAEEASDINETSKNRLIRMTATLACTKLLKQLRDARAMGVDVVKIGFAIAALNNVEQSHVRRKHAERALGQKDELVTLAWDKHLRDCAAIALRVLNDAQAKAIQKAPIDNSVKIELIGRRMFGALWRKRKVGKAAEPQPKAKEAQEAHDIADPGEGTEAGNENSEAFGEAPNAAREACALPVADEGTSESSELKKTDAQDPPSPGYGAVAAATGSPAMAHVSSTTEGKDTVTGEMPIPPVNPEVSGEAPNTAREARAVPESDAQVSPTTESSASPANPYAGKTTQELIAEAEDNYASKKAARLNRQRQNETREMPAGMGTESGCSTRGRVEPHPRAGALPARELSDYEKALLEGKTHLEAMYAQATPVAKPKCKQPEVSLYPKPNPLDSFSEPVRVTGFEFRREPI